MVVLSAPNYTIRGESSSPFLCKGIESRTYLIICDRLVYLFIYFCFLKDKCAAEGGEKIGESFNSPIFNSPPPPRAVVSDSALRLRNPAGISQGEMGDYKATTHYPNKGTGPINKSRRDGRDIRTPSSCTVSLACNPAFFPFVKSV